MDPSAGHELPEVSNSVANSTINPDLRQLPAVCEIEELSNGDAEQSRGLSDGQQLVVRQPLLDSVEVKHGTLGHGGLLGVPWMSP